MKRNSFAYRRKLKKNKRGDPAEEHVCTSKQIDFSSIFLIK